MPNTFALSILMSKLTLESVSTHIETGLTRLHVKLNNNTRCGVHGSRMLAAAVPELRIFR